MAIKRQTWIVSVILVCATTRLLANDPIVRFSSAPEFLTATPSDVIPASFAGASVACDDFLCEGCDAPGCAVASQPCQCRCPRICCCPAWIVSAEAMYLRRSNGRDQILVTDQNTGATRLSTSDFNDDYDVIPRLQVIRQWPNCNGWDVNMFGISSFDSDPTSGGSFFSPQYVAPGTPIPSTAPGTVYRTQYETELYSIEVNYRQSVYRPYLTLIAGFRWLDLSDDLDVDRTAPVQQDLFTIDTDNHMYGFQTGFDMALWTYGWRFYIDSTLRAGIFYNRADQSTHAPFFTPVPGFVDRLSAQANHTSFFGELGIHGAYRLTNRIWIRAGYRLMWLEGVALAPNQIPVNSLIGPGTAALDTGGSLFFEGATLGVSFTF